MGQSNHSCRGMRSRKKDKEVLGGKIRAEREIWEIVLKSTALYPVECNAVTSARNTGESGSGLGFKSSNLIYSKKK